MRRTLAALALALALPGPTLLATPAGAQAVVVVREGDTLSDIAERHGVGLTRLMQANGISDPDLVVVGQRLTIPGGGSRSGGGTASGTGGSVTVQAGDTLSDIAARHGISMSRLMQANGISDPDLVVTGQRLTIPGSGGRSSAPAARSPQSTAPYTVKSGETLSDIATRFNTSTERLIQLNGLGNPDLVMSGTRLQVPVQARPQPSRPAGTPAKPATPDRNARQHVVQSGESLSVIAERYGTTVERLVALNRIEDPDQLLSGTRLQLRGTPPAAAPRPVTSRQAPKPQSSAQPAPQQSAPQQVAHPAPRPAPAPTPQSQAQPQAQPQAQAQPKPQAHIQTQAQTQTRTETTPAAGSQPAAAMPTRQSAPTPSRTDSAPTSTTTTSPVRAGATAGTKATTASAASTAPASGAATAARATASTPAASARSTTVAPAAIPGPRTGSQAQAAVQTAAVQPASVRSTAASTSRITAATVGVTPTQAGTARTATRTASTPAVTTGTGTTAKTAATGATTIAARSTTRGPSSGADWRSYGPLQIDWAKWESMGGSYVAPSLNSDGKARYLAVNCTARKLNTTSPAGQWNSWETPGEDFEKKLVQDICKEKGS